MHHLQIHPLLSNWMFYIFWLSCHGQDETSCGIHNNIYHLQVLDCFNNNLSGSLPADLWRIPTLQHLSLGGNYFDGSIPPEYGSFPSLKYLGVNGNSLTGPIPSELGNLTGNYSY